MRAAVLGSPIEHSLSPALHTAGYAALGLTDWSYERHRLEPAELPGFLAGLDADWRGLSCTMPLKRAVLEVAGQVSRLAARAGAGNTLTRRPDGSWAADNTDVGGLVDALTPHWQGWRSAAVLGAGATARSALLALESLGATHATVYARNPERVAELIIWAERAEVALAVVPADLAVWPRGTEPAVLSTLPPAPGIEAGLNPREGLLFDAVYAGWPTPLARAATAAGLTVVGGLDLLVHQAARQFTLFTGHPAPLEALFAAGRAGLQGTESVEGSGLRDSSLRSDISPRAGDSSLRSDLSHRAGDSSLRSDLSHRVESQPGPTTVIPGLTRDLASGTSGT